MIRTDLKAEWQVGLGVRDLITTRRIGSFLGQLGNSVAVPVEQLRIPLDKGRGADIQRVTVAPCGGNS